MNVQITHSTGLSKEEIFDICVDIVRVKQDYNTSIGSFAWEIATNFLNATNQICDTDEEQRGLVEDIVWHAENKDCEEAYNYNPEEDRGDIQYDAIADGSICAL